MPSRGDGNRQHIIEVASRLFYHRGYNQTSFRDIAEASGIPKGNFYYYFKAKEQLLNAVMEHRFEDAKARFEQWEQKHARPIDRLKEVAGQLGDMSEELVKFGCPVGSLSVELGKSDAELKQSAGNIFKLLREWLVRQFEFMGKSNREADSLAMEFMSRLQGVVLVSNALEDQSYLLNQSQKLAAWLEQQQ